MSTVLAVYSCDGETLAAADRRAAYGAWDAESRAAGVEAAYYADPELVQWVGGYDCYNSGRKRFR
jgi:hypothetical protein